MKLITLYYYEFESNSDIPYTNIEGIVDVLYDKYNVNKNDITINSYGYSHNYSDDVETYIGITATTERLCTDDEIEAIKIYNNHVAKLNESIKLLINIQRKLRDKYNLIKTSAFNDKSSTIYTDEFRADTRDLIKELKVKESELLSKVRDLQNTCPSLPDGASTASDNAIVKNVNLTSKLNNY